MLNPMALTDSELSISDDPRVVDFHQLLQLQQEASWARDRSILDLHRAIVSSDLVITAWQGELLVGCVRILSDFIYRAVLCDVIVHPDFRGRGVGTLLVQTATEHPRLARVSKFTLLTTSARAFYERLGWKRYPGEGMVYER